MNDDQEWRGAKSMVIALGRQVAPILSGVERAATMEKKRKKQIPPHNDWL
jgi:hypothetical protein